MKRHYENWHVCVIRPRSDLTTVINAARTGEIIHGRIDSKANKGDHVLFYLTKPISAILAKGVVRIEATRVTYRGNYVPGWYMAEVGGVRVLPTPLSLQQLRKKLSAWKYWKRPRRTVRVPEKYVLRLKQLCR